jgi:hypothetical protein
MCIKLVIKTNLYYDARSEKHQIIHGHINGSGDLSEEFFNVLHSSEIRDRQPAGTITQSSTV